MTPFLDKNCWQFCFISILPISTGFLPKKEVKCYSISISRPNLEPSYYFTYYRPTILMILTFLFLTNIDIFKIFKSHVPPIFWKSIFLGQIRNQWPKIHNIGGWRDQFAEKMVITTWPNDMLEILGGRGHNVPSPTANVLAGSLC